MSNDKRNRPAKATTMQRIACFQSWHTERIKPRLRNGMTEFEHKYFPVKSNQFL